MCTVQVADGRQVVSKVRLSLLPTPACPRKSLCLLANKNYSSFFFVFLLRFDADGVSVGGIEFTLSARGSVDNDYDVSKAEQLVHDAVSRAVDYIMTHEVA